MSLRGLRRRRLKIIRKPAIKTASVLFTDNYYNKDIFNKYIQLKLFLSLF